MRERENKSKMKEILKEAGIAEKQLDENQAEIQFKTELKWESINLKKRLKYN